MYTYTHAGTCISAPIHTRKERERRLYYFKAVTLQNHKVPELHCRIYSSNLEHILLSPFTSASAPPVIVVILLFQNHYRFTVDTLEQKQKFTLGLH